MIDVRPSGPDDPRPRVVWFVNQYAGSAEHGMEFRHYELGRELVGLGATVVIISGSYSHLYARQPTVSGAYTVEPLDGLTYCWVRVPSYGRAISIGRVWNMVVFMLRLYRLPTDRLPEPDAIVVSSPSLFPILPATRWARRFGSRLLFEVRDVWPLTLRELGGLSPRHPLVFVMQWFEDRAYRAADRIVSVLPAIASHLTDRGADPGKLAIIPNGVSADVLAVPTTAAAPPSPGDARDRPFRVGFVGTLALANALDNLLEAARLLEDDQIEIVIVGQGSEGDHLRSLAADLPAVRFVGAIPKADVPTTLGGFDVCYVGYHRSPLYRFGISPNKVYDYMAAARPIILAADGANDLVQEADCGLSIPPDDAAALAAAIRSMRDLPADRRREMGSNGRAWVSRERSYATLARQYEPLLFGGDR
jgi:glycosyltransferase involved in cell wall biosynthesis